MENGLLFNKRIFNDYMLVRRLDKTIRNVQKASTRNRFMMALAR
jgi:hypothetical protein